MQRGILILVGVALFAAVVLLTRSPESQPGVPQPTVEVPIVPAIRPTSIIHPWKTVIECENPDPGTLEDTAPDGTTAVMKIGEQYEGQLVRYLEIPDGWIDIVCVNKKGIPGTLPGKADYSFEAPRDDIYYVCLRARWMDNCGDSIWVKMDDGDYYNLGEDHKGEISEKNYKWAWHQLYLGGRPKGFELKKGRHTLRLNTREDGPRLDQWVISTEATPPVGEAAK